MVKVVKFIFSRFYAIDSSKSNSQAVAELYNPFKFDLIGRNVWLHPDLHVFMKIENSITSFILFHIPNFSEKVVEVTLLFIVKLSEKRLQFSFIFIELLGMRMICKLSNTKNR